MKINNVINFILIGLIGFAVDYFIFSILSSYLSNIFSRCISISFAVFTTWILNRNYTFRFKEKSKIKEFLKYVLASKFSIGINYGVFIIVLSMFNLHYFECYVIATFFSSISNFLLYRSI